MSANIPGVGSANAPVSLQQNIMKTDRRKPDSSSANRARSWNHTKGVVLPVFVLILMSGKSAWGYSDPGSGALILQSLFAGCVGSLFFLRRFVRWCRNKISKN